MSLFVFTFDDLKKERILFSRLNVRGEDRRVGLKLIIFKILQVLELF